MVIYIVQEVISGVASKPVIFKDEKNADEHYVKLVNEVHDTNLETEREASDYLRNVDCDNDIFYWVTTTKEGLGVR